MTTEESFRVSDLVASADLVLRILALRIMALRIMAQGRRVNSGEAEWLRKTADAVRALLPEKE